MEIITLQFGSYANHVGAHFWNFDDEHSAQAEAENPDQQSIEQSTAPSQFYFEAESGRKFYPRLVAVDYKGARGGIGPNGSSPDEDEETQQEIVTAWGQDRVRVVEQPRTRAHPFAESLLAEEDEALLSEDFYEEDQYGSCSSGESRVLMADHDETENHDPDFRLGSGAAPLQSSVGPQQHSDGSTAGLFDFSTVRYWTDFAKVEYAPTNSYRELQSYFSRDQLTFFAARAGELARADLEAVEDSIRKQFERCDRADAVHAFADSGDGFGHVATKMLEYVSEEQPKLGVLVPELYDRVEVAEEAIRAEWEDEAELRAAARHRAREQLWAQDVGRGLFYKSVLDAGVSLILPVEPGAWRTDPSGRGGSVLADLDCQSKFEVGSILAPALHTATWPYQRRPEGRVPTMSGTDFLSSFKPAGAIGKLYASPFLQAGYCDLTAQHSSVEAVLLGLGQHQGTSIPDGPRFSSSFASSLDGGGPLAAGTPSTTPASGLSTRADTNDPWSTTGGSISPSSTTTPSFHSTRTQQPGTGAPNYDGLLPLWSTHHQDLQRLLQTSVASRTIASVVTRGVPFQHYDALTRALPFPMYQPFLSVCERPLALPLPLPRAVAAHAAAQPSAGAAPAGGASSMRMETVLTAGARGSLRETSMLRSLKGFRASGAGAKLAVYGVEGDDLDELAEMLVGEEE